MRKIGKVVLLMRQRWIECWTRRIARIPCVVLLHSPRSLITQARSARDLLQRNPLRNRGLASSRLWVIRTFRPLILDLEVLVDSTPGREIKSHSPVRYRKLHSVL